MLTMTTCLRYLWTASPPLTAVGLLMLALVPVFGLAIVVDPRLILGAPAWLKPTKFAVSIAVFCLTLAAIVAYLPAWRRLRASVGWTTAIVFIVEMAIIGLQAGRGATSHFNVATPLDGVLFSVMGALILLQTVMTVAVTVAVWQTAFNDRALGWALRLGLALSIAGASTGGLMTAPTAEQLAAVQAGARMTVAGSHTVGAQDGGPGLPGTNWSTEHGDLRVPHFLGLHAVQALPLLALLLGRRRVDATTRARLVVAGTVSYAGLFAILLAQALRGQSVVTPDTVTGLMLAAWAAVTLGGGVLAWRGGPRSAVAHRRTT